jgi:putative ABC transport system permease protein
MSLWQKLKYLIPSYRRAKEADMQDELNALRSMTSEGGLGNLTLAAEDARAVWGWSSAERLIQDIRLAVRRLRKSPSFTIVAILTLAFGIGANTAMFSVVNAVLLRSLPYNEPDRLVQLWSTRSSFARASSSFPDYREWRARNRMLSQVGAYHEASFAATGADNPERLMGTRMTASVWSLLQVQPMLGSLFNEDAEEFGRNRIVVLSEKLWRRRYGADPAVIGQKIELNTVPFTIVGVVPASFEFPNNNQDFWTPVSFPAGSDMLTRRNYFLGVIGRMKPDVSVAQVQSELSGIAEQMTKEFPENAGLSVLVAGMRESLVREVRGMLLLLLGVVAVVLLITCVNIANLLLARAAAQKKELTVQVALGCTRPRLLRQLLTESMLLAASGGTVGVAFAYVLLRLTVAAAPPNVPRLHQVALDFTVLGFAAALVMVTGVLFGAWPAWRATAVDLVQHLKESGRSVGRAVRERIRTVLVGAEIALSFVLLMGAGLLVISLVRLQAVDPGFRPENVLTMEVTLIGQRFQSVETVTGVVSQLMTQIRAVPGVDSVSASSNLPIGGCCWAKWFSVVGRPGPTSMADVPSVSYSQVTPDFFRVIGATLVQGRAFNETDTARSPGVAVINEALARRYWPNENPLGQRLSLFPPDALQGTAGVSPNPLPENFPGYRLTVVGIVSDLRKSGLVEETGAGDFPLLEEVFVPMAQAGRETTRALYVTARTEVPPMDAATAIQAAIHEAEPRLPVARIRSMEQMLDQVFARRRFATLLLGFFASLAVTTALVGLYGVIAYLVSMRQQELGIRIAIGAAPGQVIRLIICQGLGIALAGIGAGVALSVALSGVIESQLYAVKAINPALYLAIGALLLLCAIFASWIPARRAALSNRFPI